MKKFASEIQFLILANNAIRTGRSFKLPLLHHIPYSILILLKRPGSGPDSVSPFYIRKMKCTLLG